MDVHNMREAFDGEMGSVEKGGVDTDEMKSVEKVGMGIDTDSDDPDDQKRNRDLINSVSKNVVADSIRNGIQFRF
ncbi:hypothetical protein Syun_009445 [Stephania yunnanensis]|uniref:Uncharacterized protein n=1 Tax=Stephania yunnanensis TaxID=152371 RepID=A0AAP0PSA7_9MAGN